MKLTETPITNNSDNKKEWISPRLSELAVEETNQLPPPGMDDPRPS